MRSSVLVVCAKWQKRLDSVRQPFNFSLILLGAIALQNEGPSHDH